MQEYFIKYGEIGLRPIELTDKEDFIRWHNDSKMREKIGGIFPFGSSVFEEICRASDVSCPGNIWFAVCEGKRLIGIAGLHNVKYIQRNAEIAVLIGEEADRGKGTGSIVLQLMEKYAFGMLNLHRLYALVYSDNMSALHFFEKCGWQQEGIMHEASYWNYRFRDVVVCAKLETGCYGNGQ